MPTPPSHVRANVRAILAHLPPTLATTRQMGRLLGCDSSTAWRYAKGTVTPGWGVLQQLARWVGVTPGSLLDTPVPVAALCELRANGPT